MLKICAWKGREGAVLLSFATVRIPDPLLFSSHALFCRLILLMRRFWCSGNVRLIRGNDTLYKQMVRQILERKCIDIFMRKGFIREILGGEFDCKFCVCYNIIICKIMHKEYIVFELKTRKRRKNVNILYQNSTRKQMLR